MSTFFERIKALRDNPEFQAELQATKIEADLDIANAQIARLTAERDALKLDAERLDWCEKHLVEVGQDMSEQFRVVFLDENGRDQRSARFPSLRQAIDAAIDAAKEPK